MQYVCTIGTIYDAVNRDIEGRERHRRHVQVTHIPCATLNHAEIMAQAIAAAFSREPDSHDAEVGIRVYLRKGTVVLPMDMVEQLVHQYNNPEPNRTSRGKAI